MRRIDFSRFKKALTVECQQCLDVLSNCAYYDLRWAEDAFGTDVVGRSYIHKKMNEYGIRPSCSVVYALGVMLGTGTYDEEETQIPRGEARRRMTFLIRGVASTHAANGKKPGWE